MRIGFVNTEARSGGATRAMRRTMTALTEAGHETVLISLAADADPTTPSVQVEDQTPPNQARLAGVAHYFYNGRYVDRNRTAASDTLFWVPAVGLDIAETVSRLELDVLNIHWSAYFLSLSSLRRLGDLPIPIVFTLHDMADFTGGCHYAGGCEGFRSRCAPCPQLRVDPFRVPSSTQARRREVYARARPWAIGPSDWMTDQARSSGLFEPDRCRTIANTLDLEMFSPRARAVARRAFDLPMAAQVVLFGAFDNRERRKGFDLLVQATRQLLQARPAEAPPIIVLGFGSHLPDLGIDGVRVIETGFIDDDRRLADAYAAADVVALPSREDNLPNVMLEAMACGTPVAGFAIGGIAEVIEDGVTGALAEPEDIAGLADAIGRVLDDAAGDARMRPAARRAVQHLASPQVHARRYLEVFEAARDAAGFLEPQGRSPHPKGWFPQTPQGRPALVDFLGGWPAETLVRARARMK